MIVEFYCQHCGERLSADSAGEPRQILCMSCGKPVTVPGTAEARPVAPEPPPVARDIFCTQCGAPNNPNNFKCTSCGTVLQGPTKPVVVTNDNTLGGLIPYKNTQALIGYYLGVFSAIPCIGSPLGITAFILGIRGLKFAKKHPEAKGQAHAWVGIIVGGIFGLIYTILIGVAVVGLITAMASKRR